MSLTVSYSIWLCYMSLTASRCCLLSVNFSSSAMEFDHVSHCLIWVWLSLFVSIRAMKFLHVSHFLSIVLALSYCLFGPMEYLAISHRLTWLLGFSHCLFQFEGVAGCLSLSPKAAC